MLSPNISQLQPPSYTIDRSEDGCFVWNPPEGSHELERALIYHFPHVKGLKFKMLAARGKFIENKAIEAGVARKQLVASASVSKQLELPSFYTSTLDAKTMTEATEKHKKRRCGTNEKSEVFRNRKMICRYHKQRKTKCDPKMCPDNKLYEAPQPDYVAMVLNGFDDSNELNFADSLNSAQTLAWVGPSVSRLMPKISAFQNEGDSELREYTIASASGAERVGYSAMARSSEDYTLEGGSPDDRNGEGGGGRSNGGRRDNSGEYGDYWKGIDEDPQGTSGPFGGGNEPNGGGYPRPGGGYYSLKEEYRCSCEETDYKLSLGKDKKSVEVSNNLNTHHRAGQEAVGRIENSISKIVLG